ncbi:MAG: phosphoglycerate kinase [Xanthobacteraceae bacterium]
MSAFHLDQADVKGKRVLLRVDVNVPMENSKVTDTTRIERAAETITELADKGAKVILLARWPAEEGPEAKFSLKPVAEAIAEVIKRPVAFASDCVGPEAEKAVAAMKDGDILCLESRSGSIRKRLKNDPAFVKPAPPSSATSGSTRSPRPPRTRPRKASATNCRPIPAAPSERNWMRSRALEAPQRPVAAVVGGAKISGKLDRFSATCSTRSMF